MLLSSGKFAFYPAESDVFFRIAPAFGSLKFRSNRTKLLNAWLKSDYFRRSGLNVYELRPRVLSECRNAGDFLRTVMEAIAHQQGVRRWADNTPFHILYMAEIKKTIPNALFVHMIRDGRDAAMSLSRMGWPPCFPWNVKHRLEVSGLYWNWLVSQGRESGRKLGCEYLELRYENLVAHPRETLATLSQFIGEDLNYDYIQENAVGTIVIPNSSFPATGGLNSIGRWKNLPASETASLSKLLSSLLTELGYQGVASLRGKLPLSESMLKMSYLPYWWLRQKKIKRSFLSQFLVSREKLEPGALDKVDARWKKIRLGVPDPGKANSGKN